MKTMISLCSVFLLASLHGAAVPSVSGTTLSQNASDGLVTIGYTLKDADAIVTIDIQTNGVSIGESHLRTLAGDVNRKCSPGARSATWRVFEDFPGKTLRNCEIKAVVSAWSADNPPDYMVVDLRGDEDLDVPRVRYFLSTNSLPCGLLATNYYRTEAMVLRRIRAANVPMVMGAPAWEPGYRTEKQFECVLSNDYYIGVFEVTQSQWAHVMENAGATDESLLWPSCFSNKLYRAMRPVERITWSEVRKGFSVAADWNKNYPGNPNADSWLGRLRTQTAIAFDLPSVAQWENACRCGTLPGYWNDGSPMTKGVSGENYTTCANLPGRYVGNVGADSLNSLCDANSGTAIAGSYAPSACGLYDMHGNVMEMGLDWHQTNDKIAKWRGAVNANGNKALDGTAGGWGSGCRSSLMGGCFNRSASQARCSARNADSLQARYNVIGFRVVVNID